MSIDPDQAIFDAICAAARHDPFRGAIVVDTKAFIETFNGHRDRKLCTSLDRTEALEKECFALAANQCNHGYGDEYGHFRCARIEALEAALRAVATVCEQDGSQRLALAARRARAALAPEQDK
jgi:hypothetical protein